MNYPTTFATDPADLPVDGLGPVSLEAYKKLQDKGYEVKIGLTPEFADAIAEMAQEPSFKEFVPKDASERFKDRDTAANWLSKGRATFLLVKAGELAGYGWIGARKSSRVPGAESTFAIRIGEAWQGHGLAGSFSRLIISSAALLYGTSKLWLDTWQSNAGAVHVYHKIGAVDVDSETTQRPTSDGQIIDDTRIYMSLPDELLNP